MRNTVVSVFLVALVAFASNAPAQVTGSVGYSNFSDSGIDLGAIQGTLGYRFALDAGGGNAYFIPEARVGFGVSDERVGGAKVELDEYYGVTARFQYEADGGFYAFAFPSYSRYSASVSGGGLGISGSSWEFGIGAGFGFIFTETVGAEISYENVDDFDVLNASIRFGF